VKNDDILEVKIKKKEISLIVWLVPLLALIVGGWMIYKYYSQLGPKITIIFKKSGGLEPKSSYIKFRDVKVGVVEKVEILKRSDGVLVVARMNKDVEPFLNETTRFWIVRPQIGAGKIQGLDALMSGAYIQMYAKLGKESRRHFEGLDEPPLSLWDEPGKSFRLYSPTARDLTPGSPLFYKDIKVGKVEKVELLPDGRGVYIYAFIKEPYTKYVNPSTRFWKVEAATAKLQGMDVDFEVASLSKILAGAVAFETKDLSLKPDLERLFYLHDTSSEALRKRLGAGQVAYRPFGMRFGESLKDLDVGAEILFEGYKVGYVADIRSKLAQKKLDEEVVAMVDIAAFRQNPDDDGAKRLEELVAAGLRARLAKKLPLIGPGYVELVFTDRPGSLVREGDAVLFPTTKSLPSRWGDELHGLLQKLKNIPIEETLRSITKLADETRKPLSDSMRELAHSLKSLNALLKSDATQALPERIEADLAELQKTLKAYRELAQEYGKGSVFKDRIDALLRDIDKAARETERLMKKLERKPNAIIFGE